MHASLAAIAASLLLAAVPGWRESAHAQPPSGTASPAPANAAGSSTAVAPAAAPTPSSSAPGAQKPSAKPPADSAGASADEAAAKHAKRTACLKSAKEKKLVGTQKKAFVEECTAAP